MWPQFVSAVRTGGDASGFAITSVAPNPTHGRTTIHFTLQKAGDISLEVWNSRGERIKTLAAGRHTPGSYTQPWDGTDHRYRPVPSGTYWVRLQSNGRSFAHRIVVAR
jgi:hypothetical protein